MTITISEEELKQLIFDRFGSALGVSTPEEINFIFIKYANGGQRGIVSLDFVEIWRQTK